jgi:hypothetical protein
MPHKSGLSRSHAAVAAINDRWSRDHQPEPDKQNNIRSTSPAYKIAREILSGQPEDVKNALRDLLRVDD